MEQQTRPAVAVEAEQPAVPGSAPDPADPPPPQEPDVVVYSDWASI